MVMFVMILLLLLVVNDPTRVINTPPLLSLEQGRSIKKKIPSGRKILKIF